MTDSASARESTTRESNSPVPKSGGPESPTQISRIGWRVAVKEAFAGMKEDRMQVTAAGVAFYWFLSIFPLLFAAIGLLQLINASPATVRGIDSAITTTLPGSAASLLTRAVDSAQGRTGGGLLALIVGVALALWSASSGTAATQAGMDAAYDVPEGRKFLKKRLVALVMLFAAFLLGGLAIAALVFGRPIGVWVEQHIVSGAAFTWGWTAVRWVVALLAVVILFAVFYRLGPNRRSPSWKWISPGGIVATVVWIVVSLGFSFYISNFGGSYAETYGALVGVVVLMLWLFLTSLALFFGAELNGALERRARVEARGASGSSDDATYRRAG
jgi:membrane protein